MEELVVAENDPLLLDRLGEFLPSATTRVETALSRYPIHNLTKTESIAIRIMRRNTEGEVDISWSVSPSRDYGEPRQLAYKLDTLVINRHIDESGRPIPRLLRLGTLREICRELGVSVNGEQVNSIKQALFQNAFAAITAKITYTGSDGKVRRFEAGFTRYSVIFTGEELPNDGGTADAVYIYLNEHYWRLLNNALFRPLDYDYQKTLSAGAQRFYELVSYGIYGALSRRRNEAKLVYSDYCLRAPQTRYFTRAQMQKQMYKLHRPHIQSEYVRDIRYRQITDADGHADWEIFYAPGPRARAQYAYFTGKQRSQIIETVRAEIESSDPGPQEKPSNPLVLELTRRGISRKHAEKLISELPPTQEVTDQLEWGDYLVAEAKGAIRNPPGFYVHLLRDKVTPPPSFETSRLRKLREVAREEDQNRRVTDVRQRLDYEQYQEDIVERFISTELPKDVYERMFREKRAGVKKAFRHLPEVTLDHITHQAIRREIREQQLVEFMSFEEFCGAHAGKSDTRQMSLYK